MKKYEIDIHKLLREEKEKYHLSIRKLAERIGSVSFATLSRLLKYPDNDYTFNTYKAIAEHFGHSIPIGKEPEARIRDLTVSEFKKLMYEIINKKEMKFINHIKGHLRPDQEVICKICGKMADEIIFEDKEA